MIGLGRYNLLLKLGQGGMGAVFLARHKTLRRFCAVKVISPQYSQDKDSADRFLREARATAALTHSNLVSVFDCDQFDGQYFIAMEYVEGMTLGQVLRKQGALPLPLALCFLNQAAAGLQYIHEKNIIHRDIKPDNMIIDACGALKIMDLGLAKDHFEGDHSMTVTGAVMGSPHYMSPEQIHDSKTVDHRTDLYSLGITLYQLVVGQVPFHQSSAAAVCLAHLQEPIPSVGLADPEVAQALDSLVAKLAAKNLADRFQSAAEVLGTLDLWIANYPMDGVSQEIFSGLGFEERKVSHLLEKEGVKPDEVDADLDATAAVENFQANVPAPARSAAPTWQSRAKWAAAGMAALLLLGFGLSFLKKARNRAPSQTPVVNSMPSPKPVTPAPVALSTIPVPSAPTAPKIGSLFVKTQPEKATVIFQSKVLSSPAAFGDVPAGAYPIKVSLSGHREINQEVEIVEGKLTEINLPLQRILGSVMIRSDPPGASVNANGRFAGVTPYKLEGGDGDAVECILHLNGYEDKNLTVALKETGGEQMTKLAAIKPMQTVQNNAGPMRPSLKQGERGDPPLLNEREEGGGPFAQRLRDGNTGGQPPSLTQMRDEALNKINMTLDTARGTRNNWTGTRKDMLAFVEGKIREGSSKKDSEIKKAVSDIGSILDKAKGGSDSDYLKKKPDYANEILGICQRVMDLKQPGEAMGPGGPMGGPMGPGGPKKPPPR